MSSTLYPNLNAVAVYCGSKTADNPIYANAAAGLARHMAANDIALVYGGSNTGLMGVLADAMLECGGRVVGVFTESVRREYLYSGLTETIVTADLSARKTEMLRRSDAAIALPGSFGTLDELFDAIARRMVRSGGLGRPAGVLNVNGYYDLLLQFVDRTSKVGYTRRNYKSLLIADSTPEELLMHLNEEIARQRSGK